MIAWWPDKDGQWHASIGIWRATVHQHKIDGHHWSWRVFDAQSPYLYTDRDTAMRGCEAYAYTQLSAALRALR